MDYRIARYSAYLLALCLAPVLGFGQVTGKTYTVQDCIDIALANNIDIRNSNLDVDNARLNYMNSYGAKIPTLTLNGSQNVNSGYTIDPFTNQYINQTIRSNNFSLNSNLTLFAGNQINNQHLRTNSLYTATKYQNQVLRNQISLEVAQYYTAVLSSTQVEAAAQNRLKKVMRDRDRVQRRIEANAAAKSDLADAETQVATEELNVRRAQGDITRQKLLLAQRMLLSNTDFDIARPDLNKLLTAQPDTNQQDVYQAALNNLPDAKLARQNVLSNRFNERIQKGGFLPTITAGASIITGYSSARTKVVAITPTGPVQTEQITLQDTAGKYYTVSSSLFQNTGASYQNVKYPFKEQLNDNINRGVTLQANIPILNRLVTKNNVDNARIQRLKSENEEQRTHQVIYSSVASAILEYKVAVANLKASQKQLSSLQISLNAAQSRYEAGAGSSFDLLAQQQLYAASESDNLQRQYEVVYRTSDN